MAPHPAPRVIAGPDDLARGMAHLTAACPVWARLAPVIGPLPLRRRDDGFGAVLDAVVGQQVSVAAARAIMARLAAAGLADEAAMAAASPDALRACGLSRPKIRYVQAIARAGVDWPGLRDLPDAAVVARLVALPGIGDWTAQIYLAFALGRADAFPAADLALAEAARIAWALPERPRPAALAAMAAPWRPWRAVAARGLWAYYRINKDREGIA